MKLKKTLLGLDYDGTLVPIVKDYRHVKMDPEIKKILNKLSKQMQIVIISGRSLHYLKNKFHNPDIILIGNHGIEGIFNLNKNLLKKICNKWIKQLKITPPTLENKTYSLSVHKRTSAVLSKCRKLVPKPRIVLGKDVVNLIPQHTPNKGEALLRVMRVTRKTEAIYVGDDVTDEDVFKLNRPDLITIRVGKNINSKAKYFIKNQKEIKRLLTSLLM